MAFPTAVNSQITDSVSQVNTEVLGTAPAVALSNLLVVTGQALSNAAHNATSNQQHAYATMQASTTQGVAIDLSAIGRIAALLLLPFALGQIARFKLAAWAERNRGWIGRLDKMTIILTVYVAFSAAVIDGLWGRLDGMDLVRLMLVVSVLLALALGGSWALGGMIGLNREDRITLLFSGAQKTLATGAPMARILFPAAQAGMIVLPIMLYHQLQLMVSAWIAARLARD